jgi:hypothetical protein
VRRVAGVLLVALLALSACSSKKTLNVSAPATPPGQFDVRTFAPSSFGAEVNVPASWKDVAPMSGFQHTLRDADAKVFLLASSVPKGQGSVERGADLREKTLKGFGATIASRKAARVQEHGAVVLTYRIQVGADAAYDTEYDIARGSEMLIIVLGAATPHDNDALFRWIASTIRVKPV